MGRHNRSDPLSHYFGPSLEDLQARSQEGINRGPLPSRATLPSRAKNVLSLFSREIVLVPPPPFFEEAQSGAQRLRAGYGLDLPIKKGEFFLHSKMSRLPCISVAVNIESTIVKKLEKIRGEKYVKKE